MVQTLNLSKHLKEGLVDDERGPCGDADVSRSMLNVSDDEGDP